MSWIGKRTQYPVTECTYTLCAFPLRWSTVASGRPVQSWWEYQPDVQSSVARTVVWYAVSCASVISRRPCPSLIDSRHRSGSMVGTASSSQLVAGIASGWNDAASYEPVKRRLAPGSSYPVPADSAAALYAAAESAVTGFGLPGARRRFTGSYEAAS